MNEEKHFSESQTEAYLERLGLALPVDKTKEMLDELIYQHQCSIPFETVGMHHCEEAPSLCLDDLFGKLITQKQGGYCFELNYAFEELLRALGYQVRPALSRTVSGRDYSVPINHRGIIIELEGRTYFADVGFGGPLAAGALLLEDAKQQEVRGELFTPRRLDETWWSIERMTQSHRDLYGITGEVRTRVEVEFSTTRVMNFDFDALNAFFSRRGTLFSETYLVNLRRPNGYYGLRDNILTIRRDGISEKRELPDVESFSQALKFYFGLTYSPDELEIPDKDSPKPSF